VSEYKFKGFLLPGSKNPRHALAGSFIFQAIKFFFYPLLLSLLLSGPFVAVLEASDLSEADSCRDALEVKSRQGNGGEFLEKCINLYKKTDAFRAGHGRPYYEIAQLFQLSYFARDKFQSKDLNEAGKYYALALQSNLLRPSLVMKAKTQLEGLKPNFDLIRNTTDQKNGESIDSDAAPPLHFILTPNISFGAKINVEGRRRENWDLNDADEDDDTQIKSKLSMAALIRIPGGLDLLGEVKLVDEENFESVGAGGRSRTFEVNLNKGYLLQKRFIFPSLSLQVGRQRFKDSRRWVYDDKLDAVRIFFTLEKFELQMSVSTNLIDPEDPEDKIVNYIAYITFPLGEDRKGMVYVVNRRKRDPDGVLLTFPGISFKGKSGKRLKYWLELAGAFGTDGPIDVSGYGFDLGGVLRLKLPLKPSVTFGYAFGSGDRSENVNQEKYFRQTGLQDNEAKLGGVTKIKYYGGLFDPELSNMMITTLGIGIRPLKKASVDLLYHRYSQVERSNVFQDVGIGEDPTGLSKDIGQELDLVIGMKLSEYINAEITSGIFFPGEAFINTDPAFFGEVEIALKF